MSTSPKPGPRRQDSTRSSASSGNRTVRASRSSSSATVHNPSSGGGLFARIRGKSKRSGGTGSSDDEDEDEDGDEDGGRDAFRGRDGHGSPTPPAGWRSRRLNGDEPQEEEDPEVGPSDYMLRDRSPTPPSPLPSDYPLPDWRQPSNKPFDPASMEDGPSDSYWAPGSQPIAPSYLSRIASPEASMALDSPAASVDRYDEDEYERRLQDVLAQDERANESMRSPTLSVSDSYPYHPSHSDEPSAELRKGYKETYREIMGLDEKDAVQSTARDEEFGAGRMASESQELSDRTPSTTSIPPARLRNGSLPPGFAPSPGKRTSFIRKSIARRQKLTSEDPSVSRLRSHMRSSSSTTQHTLQTPQLAHLRTPSHFSLISVAKSEAPSTASVPTFPSALQNEVPQPQPGVPNQEPAFTFHPLRRLSAHLFSRRSSGSASPMRPATSRKASSVLGLPLASPSKDVPEELQLGKPTVLDTRGMIAVGTERGYVVVYGFGQELKCMLGNEGSDSAVTAVTISSDQTYIAVGRASGNIHLYDISSPSKPARTTLALTPRQVLSGRREGHLQGSRILHIGFVGARHTSVVSGDEHGRAFWWSLGKVMGVESNDVVRMLGSYPETTVEAASYPSKRPTTLFAASPLPLGDAPHPTDTFHLSALLTPSKLVVVGMKPSPRTWFRKMRDTTGGEMGGYVGCTAWLRSGEVKEDGEAEQGGEKGKASDPVLAYSWGKAVRFLRVRVVEEGKETIKGQEAKERESEKVLEFVEGRKWEGGAPVRGLQWYDSNHVLLVTTTELILLNVRSMTPVERTPLQTKLLTSQDFHSGLPPKGSVEQVPESLAGSIRSYRGKLFLLTRTNLQVGTLLHWNDRILSRVHAGDFLGAIQVALAYYEARAPGNTINLPHDPSARRVVIGARIRELMHASLAWAFSPERMVDDTHYSADGRGVDLTALFEGLATSCIQACLAIGDTTFLFDDVFEHFAQVGIQGIFLHLLEPFIFSNRLREVPPDIIKALITLHDERGELDLAESVIWHVDPAALDINQAVTLCEAHGLWDAMVHVYTRAMKDYVAPVVKLIGVVRDIQNHRLSRPSLVGDGEEEVDDEKLEGMAPNAYKLYAYIETVLSGLSYPSGEALPEGEAHMARTDVYTFIFQGRTVTWPQGPTGQLVLTGAPPEPPYPYLSLLLRFDTEAFLHAMDIAFEDSYLNDPSGAINRQSIVNLMLDVMDPEFFHPGDITFLHIFVARNLPKYPQFLFIPPSTLHRILVSLASDPDQSTREDRQLAAEYLLSAYTPHDADAMLALFDIAGFFRILRSAYRRDAKWGALVHTLLRDPDSDEEVFASLDEIVRAAGASSEVSGAVVQALPQLFDLGVRETAILLDRDLPEVHPQAIEALGNAPHKQMAYLRCLLEPDAEETAGVTPSTHVDLVARHLYVALLAQHDPSHVVAFLDERGAPFFDLPHLAEQCERAGLYEAELWALDRQGKVKETFETAGDVLRSKGGELGEAVISGDVGGVHVALEVIQGVSKMAVRLCQEHSGKKGGDEGSDGDECRQAKEQGAEVHVEDMWLGVLHEIIELVHSASALHSTPSTNPSPSDTIVLDTLRSLVQETLTSLVSCSSPSLSFPRLFKRLVDASTSTSKHSAKGRAYSEFRTILTGMLDSYRAEGEMLGMTTRLVEADLAEVLGEYVGRSQRGWRASVGRECARCGKATVGGGAVGGGWVVLGSGEMLHRGCV